MPVTNQQILDATKEGFSAVHEQHIAVRDRLGSLEAEVKVTQSELDRVIHLVDGNGVPPLVARLAAIEKEVKVLSEAQRSTAQKLWEITKIPLGAAIGAAATMAASGVFG